MDKVLTLVAPTRTHENVGIKDHIVEQVSNICGQTKVVILSEHQAYDIFFSGPDCEYVDKSIRGGLSGFKCDFVVQPVGRREKKILVADMDSTIIKTESLDELAKFVGLEAKISNITAKAMNGEIDFEGALRQRVWLLKGLKKEVFDETVSRIEFSPGAKTLVATMKCFGAFTALVSGGFRQFTSAVKNSLGFDLEAGNEIGIENGRLNGKIVGPVITKFEKHQILINLAIREGLSIEDTLAIGDGANDLPMLKAAGMGIAYRGKPFVAEQASFRIDYCGLESLLFFQGIHRDQFVE